VKHVFTYKSRSYNYTEAERLTISYSKLPDRGMHARRTHVARSLQPDVKSTIRTYELSRTVNDNFRVVRSAGRDAGYRIEEEMKRGGTAVIRILTELVRFQMDDPSTTKRSAYTTRVHTHTCARAHACTLARTEYLVGTKGSELPSYVRCHARHRLYNPSCDVTLFNPFITVSRHSVSVILSRSGATASVLHRQQRRTVDDKRHHAQNRCFFERQNC